MGIDNEYFLIYNEASTKKEKMTMDNIVRRMKIYNNLRKVYDNQKFSSVMDLFNFLASDALVDAASLNEIDTDEYDEDAAIATAKVNFVVANSDRIQKLVIGNKGTVVLDDLTSSATGENAMYYLGYLLSRANDTKNRLKEDDVTETPAGNLLIDGLINGIKANTLQKFVEDEAAANKTASEAMDTLTSLVGPWNALVADMNSTREDIETIQVDVNKEEEIRDWNAKQIKTAKEVLNAVQTEIDFADYYLSLDLDEFSKTDREYMAEMALLGYDDKKQKAMLKQYKTIVELFQLRKDMILDFYIKFASVQNTDIKVGDEVQKFKFRKAHVDAIAEGLGINDKFTISTTYDKENHPRLFADDLDNFNRNIRVQKDLFVTFDANDAAKAMDVDKLSDDPTKMIEYTLLLTYEQHKFLKKKYNEIFDVLNNNFGDQTRRKLAHFITDHAEKKIKNFDDASYETKIELYNYLREQSETQVKNGKIDVEYASFYIDDCIIYGKKEEKDGMMVRRGGLLTEKGHAYMRKLLLERALSNSILVAEKINEQIEGIIEARTKDLNKAIDKYSSTYRCLNENKALCLDIAKMLDTTDHKTSGMKGVEMAVYKAFSALNDDLQKINLVEVKKNEAGKAAFSDGENATIDTENYYEAINSYQNAHLVWECVKTRLNNGEVENAYNTLKGGKLKASVMDYIDVAYRLTSNEVALVTLHKFINARLYTHTPSSVSITDEESED